MFDLELVQLVEQCPIIYDKTHIGFKDVEAKNNAWRRIAANLNLPVKVCQDKWVLLRAQFSRVKKKLISGTDSMGANKPWPLYSAMAFLNAHCTPRMSRTKHLNFMPVSSSTSDPLEEFNSHLQGEIDQPLSPSGIRFFEHSPEPAIEKHSLQSVIEEHAYTHTQKIENNTPVSAYRSRKRKVKRLTQLGDSNINDESIANSFSTYVGNMLKEMNETRRNKCMLEIVQILTKKQ